MLTSRCYELRAAAKSISAVDQCLKTAASRGVDLVKNRESIRELIRVVFRYDKYKPHTATAAALYATDRAGVQRGPQSKPVPTAIHRYVVPAHTYLQTYSFINLVSCALHYRAAAQKSNLSLLNYQ